MTVLLEYIDKLLKISINAQNIAINVFYTFPIMLELCSMFSFTLYTQKYADIVGRSVYICITFWQI